MFFSPEFIDSTMDDTFEKILENSIPVSDVIKWLNGGSVPEDSRFTVNRLDFVPFFVNYLRKSCLWIQGSRVIDEPNIRDSENEDMEDDVVELIQQWDNALKSQDVSSLKSNPSFHVRVNTSKYDNSQSKSRPHDINTKCSTLKKQSAPKECIYAEGISSMVAAELNDKNRNVTNELTKQSVPEASICPGKTDVSCVQGNTNSITKKKKLQKPYEQQLTHIPEEKVVPNMSDLNEFPEISDNAPKKKKITPQPCKSYNKDERFSNPAFSKAPLLKKKNGDLKKERNILKMEKKKIMKHFSSEKDPAATSSQALTSLKNEPVAISSQSSTSQKKETVNISEKSVIVPKEQSVQNSSSEYKVSIDPNPSEVTNLHKLSIFVDLYVALLNHGFLSLDTEICFLAKLLTMKVHSNDISNEFNVLANIHNCFQFTVSVIIKKADLLNLFDCNTLALMLEIPHLPKFSSELSELIETFIKRLNTVENLEFESTHFIQEVPFKLDTDTRCNFPSQETFSSFSKQRTMFFALLEEWNNKANHDLEFEKNITLKAKELLNKGADTINSFYLAKLLVSQLLLSSIPVTAHNAGLTGQMDSSVSCFHGIQHFFAIILEAAASISLNHYFLNVISSNLSELCAIDFSDSENMSPCDVKKKFRSTVVKLCLLAKFYSFIYYLPYKSKPLPLSIIESEKEVLGSMILPIDIDATFENAKRKHHLVLMVPWICEFICMMDEVSLRKLEKKSSVLETLAVIYRGGFKHCMSEKNETFLKLCISPLLNNSSFPFLQLLYLKASTDILDKDIQDQIELTEPNCLDFSEVMDFELLYSCCPCVREFKALLDNSSKCLKANDLEIRKAIPFPKKGKIVPKDKVSERHAMFEESFLCLQSNVMKKGIELVTDQTCSKLIGEIRVTLDETVSASVSHIFDESSLYQISSNQADVLNLSLAEGKVVSYQVKSVSLNLVRTKCISEVDAILPLLFSTKSSQVIKTACSLAAMRCIQRLENWIEANINEESLASVIQKKIMKNLQASKRKPWFLMNFDEADYLFSPDISASDCLISLKEIANEMFAKCGISDHSLVIKVFNRTEEAINEKIAVDILNPILSTVLDILLAYILYMPLRPFFELVVSICDIASVCPPNSCCYLIRDFLCPGNLVLMEEHSNDSESYLQKLADLMNAFVVDKVIDVGYLHHCHNYVEALSLPEYLKVPVLDRILLVAAHHEAKVLNA